MTEQEAQQEFQRLFLSSGELSYRLSEGQDELAQIHSKMRTLSQIIQELRLQAKTSETRSDEPKEQATPQAEGANHA